MQKYSAWCGMLRLNVVKTLLALGLLVLTAAGHPARVSEATTVAMVGWNSADVPRSSRFVTVDYSTIDTYARRAPESAARSIDALSDYLTAPARSDLAKARVVYTWILSHIRYDLTTYQGGRYSSEVEYANRVLRSRRGVCTGFALLYKHLLRRAGIEVVTIKGHSRADDTQAGLPTGRVDHEWNAVRLDGDWYLLDLAWASTTAKDGQPNDYFFLTEPRQFVAQHLPIDPRWQLLKPAVSKEAFDQFPKIYDAYFRLGFDNDFPKQGLLRTGELVSLTFQNADRPVEFLCAYGRRGATKTQQIPVTVRREGDVYQLQVRLPQPGTQTLYVFAKPKSNERVKQYEGIASFTVDRR